MRTYLFSSSRKPSLIYHTTIYDNGVIQCDCPAFRECWHIRAVRDRKPIGRMEHTQVDPGEVHAILALIDEGNNRGAFERAHELFPSMSVEETKELIEDIASVDRDVDDEVYT